MVANKDETRALARIDNTFLAALQHQYPEQRFNLLVPLMIQPDIDANAIPTVTMIHVDADPLSGDVHIIEGKVALAKPVLYRMAAGAGVVWNDRECGRIKPSVCEFCEEKKCLQCQYHGRVFAYRAVGGIQYPDGSFHPCIGEYELDLSDKRYVGKVSRSDAPKRAETGAFERATRQALAIKSGYRKEDLQKPFVVIGLRYRLDQEGERERLRAALTWQYGSVQKGERETSLLQPMPKPSLKLAGPADWEELEVPANVDHETGEVFADYEANQQAQDDAEEEASGPTCGYCKKAIGDYEVDGHSWTASEIVDLNVNRRTGEFPAKLRCGPCLHKLKGEREAKLRGAGNEHR